jgi:hypothetical protein
LRDANHVCHVSPGTLWEAKKVDVDSTSVLMGSPKKGMLANLKGKRRDEEEEDGWECIPEVSTRCWLP